MSDSVSIAAAERPDAALLGRLWDELQKENGLAEPLVAPNDRASDWYAQYAREEIGERATRIYIARDGTEPVGFATGRIVHRPTLAESRAGVILDIYVVPGHRQQGIGERLHDTLLTWFRTQDIDIIEVQTLSANADAREFWTKLGYTELFHTVTRRLRG